MTLRIGFIGCGFIAQVHSYVLGALRKSRLVDARVVACHDVDTSRAVHLAGFHDDARVLDSIEAVVDASDVVWICSWTSGHLEAVRAAAAAGRAIFCEKPLAPNYADAQRVADELKRVPHQAGLVLRFAPVFVALAEAVHSGRYGRALAGVMRDDQYFPNQGMYGSSWRADVDVAGGGTLLEHSIHDVDVLRWIFGDAVGVSGRASSMFGHHGIDDVATVTQVYASGAQTTLTSVWHQVLSRGSSRRLEVFCEDALLWTDDDYLGPLHVQTSHGEHLVESAAPEWTDGMRAPLYAAQAKAFLDALRDGRQPSPDADIALAAHRVIDVVYAAQ